MSARSNIAWVDIETTGLDPTTCKILEIAVYVTDSQLEIIGGRNWIIEQPDIAEWIDSVHPHVLEMHTENGLWDCILNGNDTTPLATAEAGAVAFLRENGCTGCVDSDGAPYRSPMAGSSPHFDRSFLKVHTPVLERCFHYRNLDVSSIRECVQRWYRDPKFTDTDTREPAAHRAAADILDSIALLKRIKVHYFNPQGKIGT